MGTRGFLESDVSRLVYFDNQNAHVILEEK